MIREIHVLTLISRNFLFFSDFSLEIPGVFFAWQISPFFLHCQRVPHDCLCSSDNHLLQRNWKRKSKAGREIARATADFRITLILREINFGHFEELKTAILTILVLNFWQFCDIFKFQKIKNQSLQNYWNDSFWPSDIIQNWFHEKSEWQENC